MLEGKSVYNEDTYLNPQGNPNSHKQYKHKDKQNPNSSSHYSKSNYTKS